MLVSPKRDRKAERREATRQEILDAAWASARENGLAGLTLRDVADRVGMQPPSLYSHFASKHAVYDAMFEAAWSDWWAQSIALAETAPKNPRARMIAGALAYFDHAVSDLARHQLMNVRSLPNFEPSPEAYEAALRAYRVMQEQLPFTSPEDFDVYTALITGLVSQQLANDPGGDRWRRLLPRVISYLAEDLGMPPDPE